MTHAETRKMKMERWCLAWGRDPRVLAWIEKNPPPKDWEGSELEWAYTEMPIIPVSVLNFFGWRR